MDLSTLGRSTRDLSLHFYSTILHRLATHQNDGSWWKQAPRPSCLCYANQYGTCNAPILHSIHAASACFRSCNICSNQSHPSAPCTHHVTSTCFASFALLCLQLLQSCDKFLAKIRAEPKTMPLLANPSRSALRAYFTYIPSRVMHLYVPLS